MKEVVIVSAVRTAIGTFGGTLKNFSATQLGGFAIKGALDKINLDPNLVDDVIMGSVLQANLGQAPARQASKFAGLPDKVCATTVNKVCASGMKAITLAAQSIMTGDAEIVVAGGMECMSNVPFYSPTQRWGNKYGDTTLIDGLAKDGLLDVYNNYSMGVAAELCAKKYEISREAQDEFAIRSYQLSQAATNEGKFANEIIPISIPQRGGEDKIFDKDEEPFNVKFDKIPTLKSAFIKDGTATAANSSTINDGAAAVILMSREKAEELGIKPLAAIKSYADYEQAPEWFTTAPTPATQKALAKVGLTVDDIDYFEYNEAFAIVNLANGKLLGIPTEKVNVHGGAISMGHPLGCSGARIVVTLINILQQNNGKYGVAGICNGGGGASAIVIEKL